MMATMAGTLGDTSEGLGGCKLYSTRAHSVHVAEWPLRPESVIVDSTSVSRKRRQRSQARYDQRELLSYSCAAWQGTDTAAAGLHCHCGQVVSTVSSENRGLSRTTTNSDHGSWHRSSLCLPAPSRKWVTRRTRALQSSTKDVQLPLRTPLLPT